MLLERGVIEGITMSIDDRDYMRERNRNRNKNDYIYNPKEFRAGKPISSKVSIEKPKNISPTGILPSILVWVIIAFVLLKIFQYVESKKINNPNLFAIAPLKSAAGEQQFPESGSIIQFQQTTSPTANLTVISEQGKTENCVIKLESWENGAPVIELFVRAGERGETQLVPLGSYRVKILCGVKWYGRNEMFGENNRVSVSATPLQFWQSGNLLNGQTLSLTKRIDGNFKTMDSYNNQF